MKEHCYPLLVLLLPLRMLQGAPSSPVVALRLQVPQTGSSASLPEELAPDLQPARIEGPPKHHNSNLHGSSLSYFLWSISFKS